MFDVTAGGQIFQQSDLLEPAAWRTLCWLEASQTLDISTTVWSAGKHHQQVVEAFPGVGTVRRP